MFQFTYFLLTCLSVHFFVGCAAPNWLLSLSIGHLISQLKNVHLVIWFFLSEVFILLSLLLKINFHYFAYIFLYFL